MPKTSLSLAKTTRPTLSQVLDRERLFTRLDGCRQSPAVWISGPPGCGKSTLIASYAQARNLESLWYQVDDSDNDIATFFHYLRHTVEKHSRLPGEEIPDLPLATADWSNYCRRFFRAMFSRFDDPLLVIFDNYEALPANSELHALLAQAIDETPGRAALIFTGRGNPPAAYVRARARDELMCINGEDLRFSLDECRQISGLRQAPADQTAIEKIHAVSDGWITGIVLLLEQNRRTGITDSTQLAANDVILTDYLAGEIFNDFDPELRDFLLKVCWPPQLGIELAVKLSGTDRARLFLHNLAFNNYFVSVRDDSGKLEYVISPLLQNFLRGRARQEYHTATLRDIQRRAADLLLGENQTEAALELLLDNLDWAAAEPLMARLAPVLHEQGRNNLLAGWLDALPQDRLANNCKLLYWYAKAQMRTTPRAARQYFERAFQCCNKDAAPDQALLLDCCSGAIASILAEADDYSLLDRWIETLVGLEPMRIGSSTPATGVRPAILLLSAMMIRRPDHAGINRFAQALDEPNRFAHGGENYSYSERLYFSLIHLLAGRLDPARECLSPLLRSQTSQVLDPTQSCRAWLLLGMVQLFQGVDGAVSNALGQSREIAMEQGMEDTLIYIDLCDCAEDLMSGNTQTAGGILAKLKSRVLTCNRLVRLLYHYLASWRLLLEDSAIEACHEQQRCLQCALELGMPFLEVMSRTALAQLLFICGDERNGSAQLRRVHAIARDIHNPLLEFMTLLVYGEIAVRGGRGGSGSNALRYALGLGRNHAFYHLPWWHGTHLARLCATALREGIEMDFVQNLILRRQLPPPCPSAELPEWPWPLRIRALGGFAVERHGDDPSPVTDNLKGRPLELLGILLALGGRDIPAQEIAMLMWPRVDESYSFKSFTINLHRLRKLLNDDEAILLREGKLSLNPALVWTDIWTLESLAKAISSLQLRFQSAGGRQQLELLMERLLDCYQGNFRAGGAGLPGYEQAVQRYERLFSASIATLEELLSSCGADETITWLYQQALARTPVSELLRAGLSVQQVRRP